ncbi:unnamed protein product [Penicillium manginii]
MADLRYTEGADNSDPPLRTKPTSELQGKSSLIWHIGKPLIGEFINSNLFDLTQINKKPDYLRKLQQDDVAP